MPQSVKSRTGTLMPISVMCAGQKLDMSVPSSLIVAELLPGMVEALGRLDPETATQGYRLLTPSGRVLDHSQTLRAQHVTPGTLLTLESEGGSTVDQRYDDLVEAIGTSVNKHQDAWTKGDSAQLSSHCGVILILTAAVLLAIRGGHSMATAIIAAVGAALVCATAAIVARGSSTAGAVSLSLTVPVLLGVAGFALITDGNLAHCFMAIGVGIMFGSLATMVLPPGLRIIAGGPLLAGFSYMVVGALTAYATVSLQRSATVVVALLTLVVLSTPWIGLAQMPSRIPALNIQSTESFSGAAVDEQVVTGQALALSVKIASFMVIITCVPMVVATVEGVLLMACVGAAFMLGTRSLHGRIDVFIGVVAGMLITLATGILATLAVSWLLPWTVGLTVLVAILILAANVVHSRLRPWLTRLADGANVIALIAIIPLTCLVWGII